MGLPLVIRNIMGKTATIELNKHEFVVCRYHSPDSSVYLNDANLKTWYPSNLYKRIVYRFKKYRFGI